MKASLSFLIALCSYLVWANPKSEAIDSTLGRSQLLDSLELLLQHEKDKTSRKVEILNMLGRLYTDRDTERAKILLQQSVSLADSLHYHWGHAQALNYLGILHDHQGYTSVSANYFYRAVEILKKNTSDRFLAERLYIESYPAGRLILGPLTKQFVISTDTAIAYLQKCIVLKERLGDHLGLADAYERLAFEFWQRGFINHRNEDFTPALQLRLKAKEEYEKINFEDGVALTTVITGVCYYYLGDTNKAIQHFRKGLAMSSSLGNKRYIARSLTNLAQAHLEQGKPDSAKIYFKEAIDVATEIQFVVVIHPGLIELSKIYEAEGNLKMVSDCYLKLFKGRDLHFSQSHLLATIEMQSRYENQIKNDQIKQLELESKVKEDALQRRYLTIIFLTAFALIITIGSYIIFRNRRKYLSRISAIETNHRIRIEKERISKDLHDNIGSRLTTLSLDLRDLERSSRVSHPIIEHLQQDIQTLVTELLIRA